MTSPINESSTVRMAICVLLVFSFLPGSASSNDPANQLQQEYFVRQDADEALLIRIDAFEAEIQARVFAPERRLLLSSAMPQSRLVPIFQFIAATPRPRQLDIEVSSGLHTENSKFDIEFTRLSAWDNRSANLMRAYSLLSFGMQAGKVNSAADWTVKINSLMTAGSTFRQYGMQELRLWSAYLVAHLVQYRLHDYNMVLSLTRDILADTSGSRWREIELAALQLRSAALIGLRQSGALRAAATESDPVQAALLKTAERADAMGYTFEKAQAIRQSALEYERQSLLPMAQEQFQLALKIAESIGDDELATGIRESLVKMHAGQGDDPATSKVLQEIETHLLADGGGDELALNLLQQGRIFIRGYRYPEAISVLLQALEFENDSSIRTQLNLELAKAYFETGQKNQSLDYLQAAGVNRQRAPAYFVQKYQAALANPSSLRYSAEAMYLRAKALADQGQRGKAIRLMEALIDEVLFLRRSLPGVLGAWYWQRREQLLQYYLELQMAGSRQDGAAALDSLLALSKMRFSESAAAPPPGTDALRTLLAQAESAASGKNAVALRGRVERELNTLRASFQAKYAFLSTTAMHRFLQNLAPDEALLTYLVTPSSAYVWLGRGNKIQQRTIPNARTLYADLKASGSEFTAAPERVRGLLPAGLGTRLLGPVIERLPETVYLIPSGLLLSLPLDALQINGRFLVQDHTVINLLSFPANKKPAAGLKLAAPKNIFLAGHPQDFSGGYATRLETSAEIQAVTDIFIGPGLHIIQGAALLPDEFQSSRFAAATLAHLAMPASINLSEPEQSALELSEALRGAGRAAFRQADIRRLKLKSGLVFLSASQLAGTPRSSMSTQVGIVSAFLDAGADAVIASLWRNNTTGAVDSLMLDFYERLETTANIAASLTAAKRQFIQKDPNRKSIDWARYQVYIN